MKVNTAEEQAQLDALEARPAVDITADVAEEQQGDPVELLDRLEQAHGAATPGPWIHAKHVGGSGYVDLVVAEGYGFPAECADENAEDDAALIVAAVNALPQLTAALRAVLALHRAQDDGWGNLFCARCIGSNEELLPWPCDTFTALASALSPTTEEASKA